MTRVAFKNATMDQPIDSGATKENCARAIAGIHFFEFVVAFPRNGELRYAEPYIMQSCKAWSRREGL